MSEEMIALCAPLLGGNEWNYIKECLDTGWVSSAGSFVNRFEREIAARAGQQQAVALTSGTAALHLALLLAKVGPGEEVLVSDLTFIAPVNAIRYVGAEPVLVDCRPDTMQMDVELVGEWLKEQCEPRDGGLYNRRSGRRVAAIMPVHILGHSVDIAPLVELCRRYSLFLIEDATEALGCLYREQPVGSHSHLSCFSFNGNKIITAGGGGILTTNDPALAEKARYLSTQAKDDPLYYVHHEVGYNYRLTNIQAALAVAQLEQLDHIVQVKRELAARYDQAFASRADCIQPLGQPDYNFSTFWLYTVQLIGAAAGLRDAALQHLNSQGVQARPLWNPMHKNPPLAACEFLHRGRPHSASIVERALSLPSSAGLSQAEQHKVCRLLLEQLTVQKELV